MAGLYIHIPFCHAKCSYCDFYSTPDRRREREYLDALAVEASLRANEIREPFSTVYIGGGTPSILTRESLNRLVDIIGGLTDISRLKEFTIEANPEDISEATVAKYIDLGINRISIGIQSFDDKALSAISRVHNSATAHRALSLLRDAKINYSADLIFGLPGQTLDKWTESLSTLLSYRPPHFSSYLLSIEPGTRMYAQLIAGKISETDEDLAVRMYNRLIIEAAANGYHHYEISNYARPGCEARHNSRYWDMTPYLGLGPSAHSFDGNSRRYNPSSLRDYCNSMADLRLCCKVEPEDEADRANDFIITALRTSFGLDISSFEKLFPTYSAQLQGALGDMALSGRLVRHDSRFIIPESQWLIADSIMRDLLV